MICPFHDDSHASATVNLDENAFNCFGCGVKGDTYSIIMEQEGIDFREAITFAERITGESNGELRSKHRGDSSVSGESRYNGNNGSYISPRLRKES